MYIGSELVGISVTNKRIVVVVGVPRSGTSAISRSLKALGAEFGNNLLEAHKDVNAKGFWEDKSVLDLNERILKSLRISWSDIKPVNLSDFNSDELDSFKNEAKSLIASKMESFSLFALKEPRITKLLCFWKLVFDELDLRVSYILTLRHPSDVLNSFQRQENVMVRSCDLIPQNIYLLWISYLSSAIQLFDSNDRTVVVNYDSLLQNPRDNVLRIADLLNLEVDNSELNEYVDTFLSKTLNHSENCIKKLDGDVETVKITQDLYDKLLTLSESNNDKEFSDYISKLRDIRERFNLLSPAVELVDVYRDILNENIYKLNALAKINIEKDSKIAAQEENIASLNELNKKLTSLEEMNEKITSLEEENGKLLEDVKLNGELSRKLHEAESYISTINNSVSMKITLPFRVAKQFIKRMFG
ncbi:hypothetical protein C942_01640 [Photobacterium marinum]|uniref:Sulfotransferase domain-containing protein n=1 Tax=Photobacterium marinum TaxID=1056511 RepID=L8JBX8_9GAMM|nr:sulfotransferase domain-containing protein [Photobacterium marinum]ELR65069.1 hypothetical protein C942_01640 [Photobacterium marinum]